MAKRKGKAGNEVKAGGSEVLFTSLMIILLAFFILLNSIAVIDDERRLAALGSFIGSMGILPGGLSAIKTKGHSMQPPLAPMPSPMAGLEGLQQIIKKAKLPGTVSIGGGHLRKVISVQDVVLFDRGSYRLRPENRAFLRELAHFINLNDFPVRIEGHTSDNYELPPEIASDWEFSGMRALEVLRYLEEVGKVAPNRLSAFGYGRHRPLAPNNSQLNRGKNQRICLVLDAREQAVREDMEDRFGRPAVFDFKGFLFEIFRRP